jgi:hypothetical protein
LKTHTLVPNRSALAALLKELHKRGRAAAAIELFDWLRGLAPSHALAPLLDVYTYTTMIVRLWDIYVVVFVCGGGEWGVS